MSNLSKIGNEIQPFEKAVIDKMTPEQQEIMLARFGKRVCEFSDAINLKASEKICAEILIETASNHIGDAQMLNLLSHSLFNELKAFSAVYTWKEVRNALRMGIRNELGDYFGLSAVTFNKFLKAYRKCEKRTNAVNEYNRLMDAPPTTESPVTDMFWMNDDRLMEIFDKYKEYQKTGLVSPLFGISGIIYDYLVQKKGHLYPEEKRRQFWSKAQKEYYDEQKKNKIPADKIASVMVDPAINLTIINKAKKMSLELYFNTLIETNKNLEL